MNTEVLDCGNEGFQGLTGRTLKQKYVLGKFLASGEFGHIYEVEGGLVAKLSLETSDLAGEIKIAKTL